MNNEAKKSLVKYRIAKAKETLSEVEVNIQNKFFSSAINRLYYASFYAISALLLDNDIQAKTHSGAKQMFSLHFIKTGLISNKAGEFFTLVFELRHTGDYDDYIVFEEKQVIDLIQPAMSFIAEIEAILSKK